MTSLQLAIAAFALVTSSAVQGMIGFASGIVAIPLFLFAGYTLPEAVAINAVGSLFQNCYGLLKLRNDVPYRETVRPLVARLLTLPIGIGLLALASQLDQRQVRHVIGLVMLGLLLVQFGWRRSARRPWPRWLEWLAFVSSGVLLGFCGIGGPPLVMWVMSKRWPPARTRGLLFFIFSVSMIPQIGLLAWRFGEGVSGAMLVGLAGAPLVLAGTHFGLRVGGRLSQERLLATSFVMLLAMAVYEIAAPWMP